MNYFLDPADAAGIFFAVAFVLFAALMVELERRKGSRR